MKHFTKLLAVILVFIIALSTAACSLTPQWSYKNGDNELAIGVYIYAMYNAYSQAQTYAQQTEGYDAEAGTYDGDKSFLKVQITDDDGVTATADQWIVDQADYTIRTLLAVDSEFERLGATLDEATVKSYRDYAKEYWEYGPYYSMYGEQYVSPYADIYEPLGVSYESFEYFYISSAKQAAVFDALYADGGEKAVSDEELTEFFTDNYTSYTYFSSNLYETVEEEAEDGTTTSSNVPFEDKEVKKYEKNYAGYVDAINAGKKLSDVIDSFMSDYELESDPSVSNCEILSDSTIGEDLVAAIDALDEGKASYKKIGTDETPVMYFFYKEAIKDKIDSYIGDATNRASVLQNYKGDEFNDYLDTLADTLDIEVNKKAVKKISPEMFEG